VEESALLRYSYQLAKVCDGTLTLVRELARPSPYSASSESVAIYMLGSLVFADEISAREAAHIAETHADLAVVGSMRQTGARTERIEYIAQMLHYHPMPLLFVP
jgi:hypothetical protein